MRKLIILLSCVSVLWGCDDTFEYIANTPPSLTVNGKEGTFADSVKTSLKHSNNPYQLDLVVSDVERQNIVVSVSVSGFGKIYNGGEVVSGTIPLKGGIGSIYFEGTEDGNATVEITATDAVNGVTKTTVQFVVFNNLIPVAALTMANTKIDGPYYVELNASGSFDQDRNQGGEIQAYRYKITGTNYLYEFTTTDPTIPVNFPGIGGYQIQLEVIDNDGARSTITKNLEL